MTKAIITVQIEATTAEEVAGLRDALVMAFVGNDFTTAPVTGTVVAVQKNEPDNEEQEPKKKKPRGRSRKKDTPAAEASPAATDQTTPDEMRNEALRLLAGEYGSKNPGASLKKLLDEFGVAAAPDVSDEQAAEFLARVKAHVSGASITPLDPTPTAASEADDEPSAAPAASALI